MAKSDMEWEKQESAGLWLPEHEGEELVGTVLRAEESTFGTQWLIKKDNGEEVRTPSHKVLQNRMGKLKAGDKVKIVFVKEEPPSVKGQNPTKMYDVFRGK